MLCLSASPALPACPNLRNPRNPFNPRFRQGVTSPLLPLVSSGEHGGIAPTISRLAFEWTVASCTPLVPFVPFVPLN